MYRAAIAFASFSSLFVAYVAGDADSIRCPATDTARFQLFPLHCVTHSECRLMGSDYRCCARRDGVLRCVRGETAVKTPKPTAFKISESTTVKTPKPVAFKISESTTVKTPKPTAFKTSESTAVKTPKPVAFKISESTTVKTPKPTAFKTSESTTVKTPKPTVVKTASEKKKTGKATGKLACPRRANSLTRLTAPGCSTDSDCDGRVCCEGRCARGVREEEHAPILGVIPRECPSSPLGELLFDTTPCETDAECWPRVCCPDGRGRYCRAATARLDLVPATRALGAPLGRAAAYLQCSPPPPEWLDPRPRACSSSLDCLPHLCCEEGGRKRCRPARRSLLALVAG